eukprot:7383292-Prymnesium_polylepis.3
MDQSPHHHARDSTFTACAVATSLGHVDICLGNFELQEGRSSVAYYLPAPHKSRTTIWSSSSLRRIRPPGITSRA